MPGLIALAVAMGVGRFAFTPILPMMQADVGLTVAQGGWLATANYVGYLAGALAAMAGRFPPPVAVRSGLAIVVVATLAMAATDRFALWMLLRFAAGVASAWVLVSVSAWGFQRVGVVFAGVGSGIAAAGLVCLALIALAASSSAAWIALGLAAALGASAVWPAFRESPPAPGVASPVAGPAPSSWRLVAAYGAFGFGYIIPATFLPALAREALEHPAAFGGFWPLFGLAAAASTLLAAPLRARIPDRRLWIVGHGLMALGVLALLPGIPALLGSAAGALALGLSALLVGGTFMVVTMVGLQEARALAGTGARRLIAAMTSAFAAGQIAGPLVVSLLGAMADPMTPALVVAAFALVASTLLLRTAR